MILSSARNIPFSLSSIRRASYGLNLPLSFDIPTTLDMNLIPFPSNKSLYSRCGSFVIKHIGVVLGSTSGCLIGLGWQSAPVFTKRSHHIHFHWLYLVRRRHFFNRYNEPDILLFAWQEFIFIASFFGLGFVCYEGIYGASALHQGHMRVDEFVLCHFVERSVIWSLLLESLKQIFHWRPVVKVRTGAGPWVAALGILRQSVQLFPFAHYSEGTFHHFHHLHRRESGFELAVSYIDLFAVRST